MRRSVRTSAAAVAVAAAVSLAASCFDAPEPACAFACGEGGACPPSYRCAPDGWCKRIDVDEDEPCGASVIDAAAPDASAPPDGGEDPDAAPSDDAASSSRQRSWF